MTATEREVAYQLRQVPKQLRRAEMSVEERRTRRLALRRFTGARPRLLRTLICEEHAHCRVLVLSNRSERHVTTVRAAKFVVGPFPTSGKTTITVATQGGAQ